MLDSFQCPYCSIVMPITNDTTSVRYPSFKNTDEYHDYLMNGSFTNSCVELVFYRCPKCGKYSVTANGKGGMVDDINIQIKPLSTAKQFPDYIPLAIRNDYEEACAIVTLSPKASATLSRRCLQGMIRDFWEITESNLSKAIAKLEDKVPTVQWKVIDGIRRIGNIGAHMEKDINLIIDIEPDEAQKLIKLIEHLLDQWYINRHDQEQLYADILGIDNTLQAERRKTE